MKQINIFKKAIHTTSILLLSLTLFSCNNGTSDTNNVLPVKGNNGITVNGTISINGAGPNFSRSATSAIPSAITWVITAETDDYEEGVSGATAYTASTTQSFNISFSKSGTWIITVKGYKGTYTDKDENNHYIIPETADCPFTGMREVDIPETGLSSSIRLSVSANNTTGTGYIALEISDTSGKIQNGTATFLSTQIDSTPITKKFTFTNGTTSIEAQNIPAGSYTAKFTFEDAEDGNVLYSCKEAINVYDGLTTDTWYGNAPYIKDGDFVITNELISSYPQSESVKSSNYVLYNLTSGTYGEDYQSFLVNDLSANVDPDNPSVSFESISGDSWNFGGTAFDTKGNIYTMIYSTSNNSQGTKVYKNSALLFDTTNADNDVFQVFNYDSKTDCLFFARIESGMYDEVYFYKYSISELEELHAIPEEPQNIKYSGALNSLKFAVHNDIIYCTYNSNDENRFGIIDYGNPDNGDVYFSQIDCEIPGSIKDLLYQDGNIYILFNKLNTSLNGSTVSGRILSSRGGIIKYSTLLNTVDSCGFTNTPLSLDNKKFYIREWNGGSNKLFSDLYFTTDNLTSHVYAKADDFSDDLTIYAPESEDGVLNEQAFYGPLSFVAVKPKKLVISDKGFAYYTDTEGFYKYKNVNRIVTVDLESFAIESTQEIPEDIMFTGNFDTCLPDGICAYSTPSTLYDEVSGDEIFSGSEITAYVDNNGTPVQKTINSIGVFWGIPNAD